MLLGSKTPKFVWAFISFANPITPYVMPGDYNRDALVDQFDYQVWRSEYGKTSGWMPADGNGDGVVNAADYIFWRNNRTSGSGAGDGGRNPGAEWHNSGCVDLGAGVFRYLLSAPRRFAYSLLSAIKLCTSSQIFRACNPRAKEELQ